MPINRIVAFLTPVFAGLAGYVCQWVADHFPGTPGLDDAQLTAIFVAGAAAAVAAAYKWLDGWSKHEDRQAASDLYTPDE